MRLFLSVDLPPSLADRVASVQALVAGAEGLTLVDPAQAHVTLKFLGETDPERLAEVERAAATAVEGAGVDPFRVEVGGLGVFPHLDHISVLWAGVRQGGDDLTALHEVLERETTALGFDAERHEFTPHVTLGRMSDRRGKDLVQRVVRERDPTVGAFDVGEVHLTESTLTDAGPRYETVARFRL